MYSSILWATDGSPEADAALDEALALLEPGGYLVAFHCDQRFTGVRIGGESVALDEPERLQHLDEQVARLRQEGVAVRRLVRSTGNDPAREIATFADDLGVDAIVCGTRGLHGLAALMNGSVAGRVLRHTTVPVIVVPSRTPVCHPEAAAI
jgi:nucleotide-binding universal stress UspA family protein